MPIEGLSLLTKAGGVASGVAVPFVGQGWKVLEYAAGAAIPIELVPFEYLVRLYHQNKLSKEGFRLLARYHGIAVGAEVGEGKFQSLAKAWDRVVEYSRPFIGAEQVYLAWLRELGKPEELREWSDRTGMKPELWKPLVEMFRGRLTAIEYAIARNRGVLSQKEYEKQLLNSAGIYDEQLKIADNLRQEIPPIGDLIHFMVRDAFDEQLAKQLKLDAEIDRSPLFREWAKTQGLGEMELQEGPYKGASIDWVKMHWRSHWTQPALGQGYSMLHRLRPNRIDYVRKTVPDAPVMVMGDAGEGQVGLNSLFRSNDTALVWRPALAAISYNVLGRIDIRRIYNIGIWGDPKEKVESKADFGPAESEVYERYQDAGYDAPTSEALAVFTAKDRRNKEVAKIEKTLRSSILRAYKVGALGFDNALANLKAIDVDEDIATLTLKGIDLDVESDSVSKAISALRSSFVHGNITVDDLRFGLVQLAVDPVRQDRYISAFVAAKQGTKLELAAAKVLQLFVAGLIDYGTADQRLFNLNYTLQARSLMLAKAIQDISRILTNEQIKQAKNQKAAAREAMAAAEKARREQERLRKLAIGNSTKADILRWLKTGLATEQEARVRLEELGYIAADVERFIQETLNGPASP